MLLKDFATKNHDEDIRISHVIKTIRVSFWRQKVNNQSLQNKYIVKNFENSN